MKINITLSIKYILCCYYGFVSVSVYSFGVSARIWLYLPFLCLGCAKRNATCHLYVSYCINLSLKNDGICVINKTGRILFKTQRSFSVPTAKETKSTEETEPKVFCIHLTYSPCIYLCFSLQSTVFNIFILNRFRRAYAYYNVYYWCRIEVPE